ncbi:LysB family phage lysis regulatory protein [Enterobacter cloacae]|uniref:Rz-like lysis system protein LysB n=1 Tax=Enterobacter cloacae TaxID=550 RepID=UPI000D368986|nr:Rz-like lysis system protein LysB [Enterobacter cloacae]QCC90648.1 LysB family phage lysis regulatory protein [Enterobacter cloacae]QCC95646.1 LysB family phage lysis regulatory protein [Enterobacter cloacae]QCD12405.1 LysB family phage lysis regulatory protein [Enterobacter cloacae]
MKSLLLMLAALAAITLWFRHENLNLSRSFAKANQIAAEQKNTIHALNHQLAVSQRMARENENAQVRLRDALAVTAEEMARREAAIGRLMNENAELRRWYHTQLPDVVRRLHTRAACASAAHCLQRLPKGERLPDAGK